MKKSRKEGWMRIPIGIVSGVIIYVWAYLICLFFVINILSKIITGNRIKSLSEMSEVWNTQSYHFTRYMTFCTNEKPFPFEELQKDISKVEN